MPFLGAHVNKMPAGRAWYIIRSSLGKLCTCNFNQLHVLHYITFNCTCNWNRTCFIFLQTVFPQIIKLQCLSKIDSCKLEGHKFIISPSWSKVLDVVQVVYCCCGLLNYCIDCSAAWKLTFDEYELWIFKNDCLPLRHRGLNSELHAICGLLLFFCLKDISLCGQLRSRLKQKHYLYYISLDLWPAQHFNVLFF